MEVPLTVGIVFEKGTICRTLKRLKLLDEPVVVACVYVCMCARALSCTVATLLQALALSPGCGNPLAVCLSRRGEALLSLSLPGGGIGSPTRREREEGRGKREEGRRVGGVAWCVHVCVCVHVVVWRELSTQHDSPAGVTAYLRAARAAA